MVDSYTPKPLATGVTTQGSFSPDELVIAPGRAYVRTIASGAGALVRGTVLGRITASGKLTLALSASSDGSQTPYAILAEDVDATSADVDAVAYFSGTFNTNKMTFGTGITAANAFDPFRQVGINLDSALAW